MHQELKGREYYNGHIMNDSFREWLKSCLKEYTYQMNQVTKDRGTYTFFLTEEEKTQAELDAEADLESHLNKKAGIYQEEK